MSHSKKVDTGEKYYAVGHGRIPGVYENWTDAQQQITGYPHPVYKKFPTRVEAEEFITNLRPVGMVSLDQVDRSAGKFYAVARARVVGIFTDFNLVQAYIKDYPNPLYKKFDTFPDAETYFLRLSAGQFPDLDGHSKKEKAKAWYAVARGHSPGVYDTWDECKAQVQGFKGAKFKKFDNINDARLFMEGMTVKEINERKRPMDSASGSGADGYAAPKRSKGGGGKKANKQGFQLEDYLISATSSNQLGASASSSASANVVYTDGACSNNGRAGSQAGYGVFWGHGHPDNVSEPLLGSATNNRAELSAANRALEQALERGMTEVTVRTDSELLIKSINQWLPGWKQNGWRTANGEPVKNRDLLEYMDQLKQRMKVTFEHVRGHSGHPGNDEADRLAKAGAARSLPPY